MDPLCSISLFKIYTYLECAIEADMWNGNVDILMKQRMLIIRHFYFYYKLRMEKRFQKSSKEYRKDLWTNNYCLVISVGFLLINGSKMLIRYGIEYSIAEYKLGSINDSNFPCKSIQNSLFLPLSENEATINSILF